MTALESRMNFQIAREALKKAYPKIDTTQFVLTQSTLVLEQALVAGQREYLFPILETQNALGSFNTEIRVKYQDSFIATQMAYNICNPTSAINTAFIPDTYPNPFTYGANAAAMQSLYNGSIKMTINNEVILYNWDLMKHYVSPQTQATAAPGAASPIDQKRMTMDCFEPIEPTITMVGTNDNQLQVILNGAPASFNAFTRLRITLRGVNAQNSTVFVRN